MSPEKYSPSSSEMGCPPSTSGYVWMNVTPFSPWVPPSHSGCFAVDLFPAIVSVSDRKMRHDRGGGVSSTRKGTKN